MIEEKKESIKKELSKLKTHLDQEKRKATRLMDLSLRLEKIFLTKEIPNDRQ